MIAIANEPGILYRDMFQIEAIPEIYKGVKIHIRDFQKINYSMGQSKYDHCIIPPLLPLLPLPPLLTKAIVYFFSWKSLIRPDVDPKELGVNFTDSTKQGLAAVYEYGQQKGKDFIKQWSALNLL
ncbi:hypothetical protein [Nostoc parmelioides]|uniref:Uncharacterized protein n=1 Tax=Nostoc parmelioides FACHB-3921 TaxID=2692909 RepID=A0ABR8BDR4_9NOSO|nr:hypothetical protein [Nostoc parmelioides]MBD2252237.1 hypothetical protein [Nostoc parmelioides FACHB-3921]